MKPATIIALLVSTLLVGCGSWMVMVRVQCKHQDLENMKCLVYPKIKKEKLS